MMNNFVWKYKQHDLLDIKKISEQFSVPKSIASIMSLKKINTKENSRSFFYNDIDKLYNPLLMKDMQIAIDRIIACKNRSELILIIGDYDTDGTTAASILFLYLKNIDIDIEYYIPSREKEGYGVSLLAIEYAIKIGAKTIITCDCGITAFESIEYANKNQIDVIITDHHQPKDELPKALSILNPHQINCQYPFKDLCGAGVAFKLCMAINKQLGYPLENILQYSDLVAIATTADVMPVIDENRLLVKEGLKRIIQGDNKGIKALIQTSKLDSNSLTVGKLSYWFIPKINAAGRLGDAGRAVKLFTTSNPNLAYEIALDLENENEKRKLITLQHEEDAKRMINADTNFDDKKIIVLYNENWHFGVVGIVASRIKELYNRPTIILTYDKGLYKGSCRSINGFDIVEALSKCSDLLENYGGHPMAAGLSIKKDFLSQFSESINQYTKSKLPDLLTPTILIDYELNFSEINHRFIKFLDYLEPFGPGNSKPVFSTKNIININEVSLLGANQDTLKFTIKTDILDLSVIGFKMIEHYEKLLSNKPINIAYTIDKNYWNGKKSIQLVLKDVIYSDE